MTCVSSPELGEMPLLAYLDGEADIEITKHIAACPHCRGKAGRLARLQAALTGRLYRHTCPSSMELGEYHLGILGPVRAAAVARHLAGCPHCTGEVAQLQGYLVDLAPDLELGTLERVKEQVRVLVARLVSGGAEAAGLGESPLAPAYSGLRGEQEGPRIYGADDIQIAVEILDDFEQPDRQAIFGLILGLADPRISEVQLWQAARRVATVPVDETGDFVIAGLSTGRYGLILAGEQIEIRIIELEVGGTPPD